MIEMAHQCTASCHCRETKGEETQYCIHKKREYHSQAIQQPLLHPFLQRFLSAPHHVDYQNQTLAFYNSCTRPHSPARLLIPHAPLSFPSTCRHLLSSFHSCHLGCCRCSYQLQLYAHQARVLACLPFCLCPRHQLVVAALLHHPAGVHRHRQTGEQAQGRMRTEANRHRGE